ncbi:MAG: alpha-1,2-fucosyltransferase [Patescibacteria group bacterium]|jgi:hypothetical protein
MPLENLPEQSKKNPKIYDIFTFFNELDLLEIRLNILDKVVDYFVIIECVETFSGLPKMLYYQENAKRFEKFKHKIIHYVVDGVPKDFNDAQIMLQNSASGSLERDALQNALTSDNVPKGVIHWLKEFYQKEMIKNALLNLRDDDMCFVSDVDEIWNPRVKIDFTKPDVYKLRQLVYSYYLNNRSNEPWAGTLVTKYKNIKNNCLNHLRTSRKTKYTYVENGGWHFTNQGGAEQIKMKIESSYGQEDYNNNSIKSKITERILKNKDYIGRKFKFWIDESDLPKYILDNKEKYRHLFNNQTDLKSATVLPLIIKLHGGLGNQLFEYALGRSLALTKNVKVKYDISWFAEQTKRKYELDNFNVKADFATNREVNKLKKFQKRTGYWGFIYNFFFANDAVYIKEKQLSFDPKILEITPPAYLEGYWQSEKYFAGIADQIRKNFTLKNLPSRHLESQKNDIANSNAVSLHIRRTDYLTGSNGFYHICSLGYYQDAIKLIEKSQKNLKLFVFSDDINWVKENLKTNQPMVFLQGNTSYEDLILMSLCKHNIIANSTFSLWGAWLNANPNKIVVAPKKWFTDPKISTQDLVPSSWFRI